MYYSLSRTKHQDEQVTFLYYFLLYFLCTFFVTSFYTFYALSLLLQRFHCVANNTVGTRYRATDSARIAAVSESLRWKRDSAASCLKTKFVIVLPRSAPSPTVVNSVTGAYDASSLTATKGVTAPSVMFVRKRGQKGQLIDTALLIQ